MNKPIHTKHKHLIILMAFLCLLGINANTAWGQEKAIYKFNLYNLPVRFERLTVGGKTEYYCGYWNGTNWSNHTNTASGDSYRKRCADYEYIQIFHVENHSANDPGSAPPATATNNTVEIVTHRNNNYGLAVPSSNGTLASVDGTLKIELNNVRIEGVNKSALNLGDDCVSVELTLVGTNYLSFSGGSTGYPVIAYNRWDGTTSHNNGWKGPGTLSFLGSGSLTATRPSEVNSGAVIGCAQFNQSDPPDCLSNGSLVFNGTGTITAQVLDPITNDGTGCGSYGAAIGGGGNSNCGNITIKSGTINAYANTTAAAIGSGGGLTGFGADVKGIIQIEGGTVNTYSSDLTHCSAYTYTWDNTETGVGIGAGSSNYKNGGTFQSGAKIVIKGGTVNVNKRLVVFGSAPPNWERGNIGGGNSNTGGGDDPYPGGAAVVEIYGGTVTAANIGGGSANKAGSGANGGAATVKLQMAGGSLNVSGTIGGGSSISGTGGNATVNVYAPESGTAGTVTAGNIGGGDSQTGAGGQATVNVYGGSLSPGSIGGGNSTSGSTTAAGGQATVNVSGGTLTVTGKIGGGKSFGSGAGGNALIHVSGGTLSCQSIGGGDSQSGTPGSVYNNSLTNAGVLIDGGTLNTGTIGGGTRLSDEALGKASVKITAGTIQGQCLLVATGTTASDHCWFEMTGGTIDNSGLGGVGTGTYPRAKAQGGAVYMEDTYGTVSISGGTIQNCTGSTMGGAVYMTHGTFSLTGLGTIQDCSATTSGGAVHLANGTVTINGGNIGTIVSGTAHPNSAPQGGGIYLGDGNLNVYSGTVGYNTASSQGGGAYLYGGTLTMTGGTVTRNQAANGGGIYVNGGTSTVSDGDITYNTATTNGGGIYANGGELTFSDGNINYNKANTQGGGIYVATDGTLNLRGTATLSKNHVPTGEHGGGVYLLGVVVVGESSKTQSTILAQDNFAHTLTGSETAETYTCTSETRNNIYLPAPTVNANHKDVITVVENGLTTSTRVGFSVPANFVPVIYCDESDPYTYLESFLTPIASDGMKETVFDDAEKYTTVHYTFAPYDAQYIYLSSGTWVEQVTSEPSGFSVSGDNVTISSEEGLAWLIRYINGISPVTQSHPGVSVTLTKDLNMGDYPWVPMASKAYSSTETDVPFTGTFNGQGYTIANLDLLWLGPQTGADLGLFGNIGTNGTVKNVSIKDASITTSDMTSSNGAAALGAIAGRTSGGTIMNCVASSELKTANSTAVMGGLVGQVTSGTVHSSYAAPEMKGYTMGGLVGNNAGDLYNSFANAKFDPQGTTNYMGGLVGVNTGRVENCYSRVQATVPSSTYFGYLAGNNTSTSDKGLYFCYAPTATYVATASGTTAGNRVGLGTYGATSVPYLYNHRDNQVNVTVGANTYVSSSSGADKQMLIALNKWVAAENGESSTYTYWLRTTTKTINDDLPLLRLPATNAVAATNGDAYLDYNQVNDLLRDYTTSTKAICLYGAEASMNGNAGSAAPLYIDQEATLKQSGSKGAITARTSQMLNTYESDGKERWHHFSSPLTHSDIGFTYHNTQPVDFDWGSVNPCSVTITSDDDYSLFPSDLLSKTSFASVDLYCYYEPEYHWLNLKRASDSHWHMNAPTASINYEGNGIGASTSGNETYLVPGKGYLVSIDVDQLVQNYGTLNDGNVTLYSVTKSDYNAWAERLGFNLLGNPYQSYLDFERFITENKASLWASDEDIYEYTYAVFDPKLNAYRQYKNGTSFSSYAASQYIHPHQGFFIRMTKGTNSNTTVTYTNDMRLVSLPEGTTSPFRGETHLAYPLINLVVNDSDGHADIAVLELDRDNDEGAEKIRLSEGKGVLSLGYDGRDYGILFRTEVEDYQPLRFDALEEGTFTLTWNTANAEFEKLTLIDNITGTTTDMLSHDSYSFEANPDQYSSRFKIVIGDYKDIEENEDGPSTGSGTSPFAYYANGEIHLVETQNLASLQVIDMTGRVILSRDASHASAISTTGMVPGVYVLRLTTSKGSKIQKMVIE